MRVGFVGGFKDFVEEQKETFSHLIKELNPEEYHHGDLVGSEKEAHDIVRLLLPSCKIHIHPSVRDNKRAFCKGDVMHIEMDYVPRDLDLLEDIQLLIVCHMLVTNKSRLMRSTGPNAMISHAKEQGIDLLIIDTKGHLEEISGNNK